MQRRFEDDEDIEKSLLVLQSQMEKEIGRAEKVRRESKTQASRDTFFVGNDGMPDGE